MVSAPSQDRAPKHKSSRFVLGRAALSVVFVTGLTAPALMHAAPAAAQPVTVSFSTAAAAPADSLAYIVSTLDNDSE